MQNSKLGFNGYKWGKRIRNFVILFDETLSLEKNTTWLQFFKEKNQ